MTLNFKKLMTVSAVALTVALVSSQSIAADGPNPGVESGAPVTVSINATVDNNFDVAMTPANFGTIAVVPKAAGNATIVMAAATGNLTDQPGATAADPAIIAAAAAGTPITVAITGALATQTMYATINSVTHPVNAGSTLNVTGLTTNLAVPGGCTTGNANTPVVPATHCTAGSGVTDGDGDLSFNIGLSLSTVQTATPYVSGAYVGELGVILSY